MYSLVTLGARRPVRHLASVAMAKIITTGDSISIYSRASSLQGFLSDGKRSDPQRVAGRLYVCKDYWETVIEQQLFINILNTVGYSDVLESRLILVTS